MQDPRFDLISHMISVLEGHGWSPSVEQHGSDFLIGFDEEGLRRRILVLAPEMMTGPCFIRLEQGEVEESGRIWAVISGVPLGGPDELETKELASFQTAIGDGWLVMGFGMWLGESLTQENVLTIERLIDLYDEMGAEVSLKGQSGWNVFTPGASPLSSDAEIQKARTSKFALPIGTTFIGGSVLGTAGLFFLDPVLALAFMFNIGLPGLAGGALAMAHYFRRRYAPSGCSALARKLKSSAVFDTHDKVIAIQPLRPLVISLDQYDRRSLGTIEFRAGLLGARSSEHDLALRVSLQTLSTSARLLPECQIVPGSWAVVELTGPDSILSRLPSRPREERSPGRVFWLLDHEELYMGAMDELLSNLNVAVEASAEVGPYR